MGDPGGVKSPNILHMFCNWNTLFQLDSTAEWGVRYTNGMDQEKRSIFEFQTVPEFLAYELEARIRTNPRYSLRALAKHLTMSPGELSEIIRGKRALSLKVAQKIAQALEMSPAEFRQLLALAATRVAATAMPLKAEWQNRQNLDEDRFRLVSDWWCFSILNFAECAGFEWDANVISRGLGITAFEARQAMERLERLALVVKTSPKTVHVAHDFVEHLTNVPSTAIRRYHRSLLEKAIAALDEQAMEERDITGVGMAIDQRDLPAMKSEIAEFQDRLMAKYAKGTGSARRRRKATAVYQLEMALYRLTQKEQDQ
ncbi:MAG: TIGR02147 family protein [Bdellovibrionales bacterium]|nr:TIGR02147 family protein [Bdellovibrionales bacterium]